MRLGAVSEAVPESAPDLPYRVTASLIVRMNTRCVAKVGHGFDLHRLEEGLPLIIGGIDIPSAKGCDAHSDGKPGKSSNLLLRLE